MFRSISMAVVLMVGSMFATSPASANCKDVEVAGTVAGAIVGGIIGNQFGHGRGRTAATVGGVVLGGIAGNAIARDSCKDKRSDQYYYDDAYYDSFNGDDERRYDWDNPYNNHSGYVQATDYYEDGYNGYEGPCRQFEQRIYIDGQEEVGTGVACRNSDGTWRIVSHD